MTAAYRVTWYVITAAVCAVGLAGGCVVLGPFAAGCLAGVGAVLAATAVPWQRGAPADHVRRAVGAGLGAAVLPLTVIGLLAELGPVALLLCLLLAAGGWPLLRSLATPAGRHRRRVRRSAPRPPALEMLPPENALPLPGSLEQLGTAELCRLWRISYARLERCCWPWEREQMAQLRRACLDELERRDPAAFARWVGTARAAGDPGRYFPGGQRQA